MLRSSRLEFHTRPRRSVGCVARARSFFEPADLASLRSRASPDSRGSTSPCPVSEDKNLKDSKDSTVRSTPIKEQKKTLQLEVPLEKRSKAKRLPFSLPQGTPRARSPRGLHGRGRLRLFWRSPPSPASPLSPCAGGWRRSRRCRESCGRSVAGVAGRTYTELGTLAKINVLCCFLGIRIKYPRIKNYFQVPPIRELHDALRVGWSRQVEPRRTAVRDECEVVAAQGALNRKVGPQPEEV